MLVSFVGLVVVGDQRAFVGLVELPVEPDPSSQREHPLRDTGEQPGGGASAVALQAELAFARVEDRLGPLADPAQRPEPDRLVLTVRADQHSAQHRRVGLELDAPEAFAGPDDLPGADQMAVGVEQRGQGSRSPRSASAGPQMTGVPSGAQTRYRRMPQSQRERDARQP